MEQHRKKMIAPIVITVIMILYYIFFFVLLLWELPGVFLKICFGIIPVCLSGVMLYVCHERINEIRSGEEDDISEY